MKIVEYVEGQGFTTLIEKDFEHYEFLLKRLNADNIKEQVLKGSIFGMTIHLYDLEVHVDKIGFRYIGCQEVDEGLSLSFRLYGVNKDIMDALLSEEEIEIILITPFDIDNDIINFCIGYKDEKRNFLEGDKDNA